MKKFLRYAGQAVFYGGFAAFLGFLSVSPSYTFLPEGQAVIKLTLNHGGKTVGNCRKPTAKETEGYPRNLVPTEICPRERSPVKLSMGLDGKNLIRTVLQPSGLHNDGSSATYQRFSVAAGEHELLLEMSDDVRAAGPTHRQVAQISLKPAQVLVINFDTAGNRFIIE